MTEFELRTLVVIGSIEIMLYFFPKQEEGVVVVIVWYLVFQLPVKSIQHFVIEFVSDLLQVGGFLWVLMFPPPIKLTARI